MPLFHQVLAVHENTDAGMVDLFEKFNDHFRLTNLNLDQDEFRYNYVSLVVTRDGIGVT